MEYDQEEMKLVPEEDLKVKRASSNLGGKMRLVEYGASTATELIEGEANHMEANKLITEKYMGKTET